MSTNLGPALPQDLIDLFSGSHLAKKIGLASILVTAGADGFPHPCIVTPGELIAHDASTLRVALYETSTASRNMRNGSKATLCLAHGGCAYYVKMTAESFPTTDPALAGQAVFTLRPEHVLRDVEEGAEVTSGFQFRDQRGEQAVLAQWDKITRALKATFA